MSPYQVLVAATRSPARFLNRNAGTMQEGQIADLVLLGANPLNKIESSRDIRGVLLRDSTWLDQASCEHLEKDLVQHFKVE